MFSIWQITEDLSCRGEVGDRQDFPVLVAAALAWVCLVVAAFPQPSHSTHHAQPTFMQFTACGLVL